jgi:hypothetical protein
MVLFYRQLDAEMLGRAGQNTAGWENPGVLNLDDVMLGRDVRSVGQ